MEDRQNFFEVVLAPTTVQPLIDCLLAFTFPQRRGREGEERGEREKGERGERERERGEGGESPT